MTNKIAWFILRNFTDSSGKKLDATLECIDNDISELAHGAACAKESCNFVPVI